MLSTELQYFCDADESDIDELIEVLQTDAGMTRPAAKSFEKAWQRLHAPS